MNRASTVASRAARRLAGPCAALGIALALGMGWAAPNRVQAAAPESVFGGPVMLTYRKEYPVIHYTQTPRNNPVARLQRELASGKVKLQFHGVRGYLDSLLAALDISPASQTLVYSKSSLQTGSITAATPRAIYFNDRTYVGWVQGKHRVIEIATMDRKLDQVFYTLANDPPGGKPHVQRKVLQCLACHDTYELSGGGVPRFLLMSTYVDVKGRQLTHEGQIITSQQTPLKYRWGGWYVTGLTGKQVHLGNIQVTSVNQLLHLDKVRRVNVTKLDGLFDTKPYITDKSDIVALLVLQHQVDVQNLITRVNFEVREALAKAGGSKRERASGAKLSDHTRQALRGYMDSLVDTMLLDGATPFTSKITGNSGFKAWFESQGPHDPQGRSLRDLDLTTRLFKYRMSFLIYSPAFNDLPAYAKNYLYGRFAAILTGKDLSGKYTYLGDAERQTILEILKATKPDFAHFLTEGKDIA
ncbi:MAG: hypothetical protein ACREU3_11845 [Steroidobacteraceae bacterium]